LKQSALLAMLLLAGCAVAKPVPQVHTDGAVRRIVSMNPCVDAVLRDVAAPDQIAAVSHYSHDPRATSVPLTWSLHYAVNNGSAEDVIAANPDLVIAGPHVAVQTIAALKRLGIPLMQVTVPETIDENKAQITAIASRIGRSEAGRALNSRIDAELARTRWTGRTASALIWQGSGLVPGKGTLADELLTHTGFRNSSSESGLKQWDILPLEGLFLRPPEVLFAGRADMGAGDGDANRMLSHPALRKAGTRFRIENYPSNLLHCGGPVILRSLARLASVRRGLEQRP
jgi:iron complex transport system substrate-binding protein